MDIITQAMYLVANAFHIYVFYSAFRILLGTPKSCVAESISFICMYIVNSLAFLLLNNPVLNLLTSIVPLVLISMLFSQSMWTRILISFMICAVSVIFDVMSYNIIWIFIPAEHIVGVSGFWGNICGSLLLLLLCRIAKQLRSEQNQFAVFRSHWIAIFVVTTGSILAISIVFIFKYDPVSSLFIISIFLLINVVFFWLFDKMTEYYKTQHERQLLSEQIHIFTRQLELIEENNQAIHRMRHDMKNHLAYLSKFLYMKEIKSAQDYLEQINVHLQPHNEYVNTKNPGLDSFLNYKLDLLYHEKIFVDTKITIPERLPYPDFELCVILGNLLDNAYEALQRLSQDTKKILNLTIRFDRNMLYIMVSNSFDGKLKKSKIFGKSLYQTIKENTADHGKGLANVARIVDLFEGSMDIYDSDYIYTVEIILLQRQGDPES